MQCNCNMPSEILKLLLDWWARPLQMKSFLCYRPQRSCGQGNVFTGVCLSTGGGVCLSACWDARPPQTRQTPRTRQTPPGPGRPPPDQADPPTQTRQTPPRPGRPPQTRQTPLEQADTPPEQVDTPLPGRPPQMRRTPPEQADPPREADSSIRSTSGRYASYWNAFLL